MAEVLDRALADAAALAGGDIDGVVVENFGDTPFLPSRVPPETVAAMATIVAQLRRDVHRPVGINVLRNDARAALAIAAATGAAFIRVNIHTGALLTDQGWIRGRAFATLRERRRLGIRCAILADIAVKHAVLPPGLDAGEAARDAWHRGLADGLIVSGRATGDPPTPERIAQIRSAVPEAPLWLGSGVDPENAGALIPLADGVIVGSALQHGGRAGAGVDPGRVRAFVSAARAVGAGPA